MILRDYQIWGQEATIKSIKNFPEENALVVAPTGVGKSLMIAAFIKWAFMVMESPRILVLTHVKELIEQDYKKTVEFWPSAPVGIHSSGLNKYDKYSSVIFGGVQTVVNNIESMGCFDFILIDEAHLVSDKVESTYTRIIEYLKVLNPKMLVIGYTATKWRMDNGLLTEGENKTFVRIAYDMSGPEAFQWLFDQGYLCRLITKRTRISLTDEINPEQKKFTLKSQAETLSKMEMTEKIIQEVIECCSDRKKWLIFTTSIEHAENTHEILNMLGVSSTVVHSGNKQYKMSNNERDERITKFKKGGFRALVNTNILTTGFDDPEIDLIVVIRMMNSTNLWVQILGRGTRPNYATGFDLTTKEGRLLAISQSSKKNCLIMDFGKNIQRLGPINNPKIPDKRNKKKTGVPPVKFCNNCDLDNHPTARFCVHCGEEFTFQHHLQAESSSGDIIENDVDIIESLTVKTMVVRINSRINKTSSLVLEYACGLNNFKQYLCFNHNGYPKHKANKWWREFCKTNPPQTVSEAYSRISEIPTITHVRVITNRNIPEFLAFCVDGSNFGTQPQQESSVKIIKG